jgi:hypothetical protein
MNICSLPPGGRWLPGAVFLLAVVFATLPARAELGGDYNSILQDRTAMHATLTCQPHAAYNTYILDMPDGTQVREYYSVVGVVFAVDWSGRGHRPDMRQALGAYFERFGRPENLPLKARNSMLRRIEPDIVLESRVVMRRFKGRAYLPQFVPQEAAIADVR